MPKVKVQFKHLKAEAELHMRSSGVPNILHYTVEV